MAAQSAVFADSRRGPQMVRLDISIGLLAFAMLLFGPPSVAQEPQLFRIGTGGVEGSYYPVAGIIAQAISNPPGQEACNEGNCRGVPGLVALAQASNGSIANIEAIAAGRLESGFAQADTAYWAHTATGNFHGQDDFHNLRAIASLYPETVHLVARKESGIRAVSDLRGKRVGLDEPGSGTLVDARIILQAFGLDETSIRPDYTKPAVAAEKLLQGRLDAFFIVAGHPTPSIDRLTRTGQADLISIDGPEVESLLLRNRFFSPASIPSGTYQGIGDVRTLSVRALWLVGAELDAELVYQITKALWSKETQTLLNHGHVLGREIKKTSAVEGIAIPLHPGAQRFYQENALHE